ncbi:MAG: DUF2279 domain-containing protein [Flavobacteriales bacterium]
MKARIVFLLLFFLLVSDVFSFGRGRRRVCEFTPRWKSITTWGGHGAFYVGTYIPLYSVWYKDYPKTSFHFFNDNNEWRSMDKMGHTYTGFKLASFSYRTLDWAYPFNACSQLKNDRKKTYIASAYSMLYLTTLEIFDGFSSGWGFSGGDMAANTIGIGLFAGQKAFCREIFMRPKFSYHATNYPNYRPELLGTGTAERGLKDYNGQTYWLSISIPFEVAELSKFKWIAFSVGYNASGMTGGSHNPSVNQAGAVIPYSERTSSTLLSMDIDWERFRFMQHGLSMYRTKKDKKVWLRILLIALNTVKLPFPAVEFVHGGKTKFHWFYF